MIAKAPVENAGLHTKAAALTMKKKRPSIFRLTVFLILLFFSFQPCGSDSWGTEYENLDRIRFTCMNYMKGWYQGDTGMMKKSLHPSLAKRSLRGSSETSQQLRNTSSEDMIHYTGSGYGKELWKPEYTIEFIPLDIRKTIASVKMITPHYLEYLHLAKFGDQWLIVNALYEQRKVVEPSVLTLSFADSLWDGKTIPQGQQCLEYDGKGASPRIIVKNIPAAANKLILEFSDATYRPCDDGGHGIIGYRIETGTSELTLPSIPGQTFDLPAGFTMIREHCGANLGMQRGAYIGPCPGYGNFYYLVVKAVYIASDSAEQKLLGVGKINIGTYSFD